MDRRHLWAAAALQRQWAEEVYHLHSLWHLGPPQNPNPNPNPNPTATLRPHQTTAFKKSSKNKMMKKSNVGVNAAEIVEKEWPIAPTPQALPESSNWGIFKPSLASEPKRPSADEEARSVAVRIQYNALKECRGFFSKKDGSDSEEVDDDDDDEEEEEEDEGDGEDDGKLGSFQFFIEIFKRDHELREYYEKNSEKGEFYCLVCEGTGMKTGKKFRNCTALVQHAHSISKTNQRIAHRAFAMAVCRVLGWDFKRMPNIVLDMRKRLGETLVKDGVIEDTVKKDEMKDDTTNEDKHAMHDVTEKGTKGLGELSTKSGEVEDDTGKDKERLGESLGAENEEVTGAVGEKLEESLTTGGENELDYDESCAASLRPQTTTTFKKLSKNKIKKNNVRVNAANWNTEIKEIVEQECTIGPRPATLPEWSSWGIFPPPLASVPKKPSADEQAHSVAIRIQYNSRKACHAFFSKKDESDSEEVDDDDEEEDDEEEDDEGDAEDDRKSGSFKFFIDIFKRDHELREYYEKNSEKGEFYCLVCEGTGMKTWKKFLNCTALVQHAHSISKTKRKVAHRAFAMAVCRVLGWDFKRMPSIVLDMRKRLGETLVIDGEIEDTVEKDDTNNEDNHAMHDVTEMGPQGSRKPSLKSGETEGDTGKDGAQLGESLGAESEEVTGSAGERHDESLTTEGENEDGAEKDATQCYIEKGHHTTQNGAKVECTVDKQQILEEDNRKEDFVGQQYSLGHNIEEINEAPGQGSNFICLEMTTTETLTMEPEVGLFKDETKKEHIPDKERDLIGFVVQTVEGSQSDAQI